jgi:hypothetical protein
MHSVHDAKEMAHNGDTGGVGSDLRHDSGALAGLRDHGGGCSVRNGLSRRAGGRGSGSGRARSGGRSRSASCRSEIIISPRKLQISTDSS